jgi:hypothetical protein
MGVSVVDVHTGKGVGMISGWMQIPYPTPPDNYFVLYLSHSEQLSAHISGEHGTALLESLERTMRGLFYFGEFSVNLV